MEFDTLIRERRSIRQYTPDKEVTAEQISALVAAAIEAPSWKNSQTARYHAVLSKEMRERFAHSCLPEGSAKKAEHAALVVTTFLKETAGFTQGQPDNECADGWGFYDLGLQNALFLLKAKELGLDTLVMGLRDAEAIRELLQIPQAETIVSVIAVGYAAQPATHPPRKTPAEILKFY